MRPLSILILLLHLIPAHVFAQEIQGFIRDHTTGKPVSNANIFISGTSLGTVSDKEGRFTLKVDSMERVAVAVSHIGYSTLVKTMNVPGDGISGLIILLSPVAVEIGETVITATRTRRNITEIPAAVKLFTAKQIEEMPATAIDDILATDASINVDRKNGIFSKNASVTMRGLNSSARTLVMLDGMPLNKADGGGVNYNRLNPESIERIEIVKGPGSALYGGNAMGGVINIISRDIDEKAAGSVKASLGSYNTQALQAFLSGRPKSLPKFGYSINSFYRRGDGYIIAPRDIRDSTDVKTKLWEYNAGGKLAYYINDSSKVEAGYNYFDDKQGDGVRIYDPEGGYYTYRTHHAFVNYRGTLGKTQLNANANMQRENYLNQKEQIKTDKLPPYAVTQYMLYLTDSHRNDAGMWLAATTGAGVNHKLTYGADIRLSSGDQSDVYFTATDTITNTGTMNSYALFVQDEFSMMNNRLKVVAGARADAVYFGDASFSIKAPSATNSYMAEYSGNYNDKNWLSLSPKIGVHYSLNDENSVYANYATGFRPGTLDDMCRSGSISKGFKMANPDLEPEHIYSLEAGGSFELNRFIRFEPAVYYSLGRQFQYFVGTGDTIYSASKPKPILKRENVSKAAISGAEATLSISPAKSILISLSYAYNHSVIKAFDTLRFVAKDLTGKFLMEVPKNRFTALANWKNRYFNAMLIYEYTGSLYIDDENLVEQPSYYKIDAKVSRLFAQKYSLSISIQNITNTIYTDKKGFLGMGRFFMLEAAYRF